MKDLVNEANLECSEEGLKVQAMDSSHVSLISLTLGRDMFDEYRCDRNLFLGLNLGNLAKILKCANNDDSITLSAQDEGDSVTFHFQDKKDDSGGATFELKLMDIDGEHLAIPDTEYKASVQMPAAEFQRICRDMATIGDTCEFSALNWVVGAFSPIPLALLPSY
jgi:proliferating cell nuclear antigen